MTQSVARSLCDSWVFCWWGYWPKKTSSVHVCAKGRHFESSFCTDDVYNVNFVHICFNQCDLFDCCILNYNIMPAIFANIFLLILQGSALADLGFGGILGYTWLQLISVCNSEKILKSDSICRSYAQWKSIQLFLLTRYCQNTFYAIFC